MRLMKGSLHFVALIAIVKIGFSQEGKKSLTDLQFNGSPLVFHNMPIVNIELHDVKIRSAFNYNLTRVSIQGIRSALVSHNLVAQAKSDFTLDSLVITKNKYIAKEFIRTNGEYSEDVLQFFKEVADKYENRYICFTMENGFGSSTELQSRIVTGNARSYMQSSWGGFDAYEYHIAASAMVSFIIWDKKANSYVYKTHKVVRYNSNFDLVREDFLAKQVLKLKKKLIRGIKRMDKKGYLVLPLTSEIEKYVPYIENR